MLSKNGACDSMGSRLELSFVRPEALIQQDTRIVFHHNRACGVRRSRRRRSPLSFLRWDYELPPSP
jgi:hypothetical protein